MEQAARFDGVHDQAQRRLHPYFDGFIATISGESGDVFSYRFTHMARHNLNRAYSHCPMKAAIFWDILMENGPFLSMINRSRQKHGGFPQLC